MFSSVVRLVSVVFTCALATPASADLLVHKDLSLATAVTIATTAADTCKVQGPAYTSRTFRIPSGEMVKRLKDNPQLGAIHLANVIAAQGALPSWSERMSSMRPASPAPSRPPSRPAA